MILNLRKYVGLPLVHKTRRLARAFLDQTKTADEVRPMLGCSN